MQQLFAVSRPYAVVVKERNCIAMGEEAAIIRYRTIDYAYEVISCDYIVIKPGPAEGMIGGLGAKDKVTKYSTVRVVTR